MVVLLKTTSIRVRFIQIMQIRVQNKSKSVWKSRYARDVSLGQAHKSLKAHVAWERWKVHLFMEREGID